MRTSLDILLIPWALVTVSLFNTVLLWWLGLTVLLNARRKSWGNLLAGVGLIIGGIFFVAHTAALDYTLDSLVLRAGLWWLFVALPVVVLPLGWMVLMLWYCGCWEALPNPLARLAKPALLLCCSLAAIIVSLLALGAPHLKQSLATPGVERADLTVAAIPLVMVLYPPYLLGCIVMALWALVHPAPSGRILREEARKWARPWLVASTLVQLAVSVLVAAAVAFLGLHHQGNPLPVFYNLFEQYINPLDLFIVTLIAVAVMLLGKAIVSFEIFTEKVLPRRGFLRQWRSLVFVAAIYSGSVALVANPPLPGATISSGYAILLATVLMSTFLAVVSHRVYDERERAVSGLRPFVSSQHFYEALISGKEEGEQDSGFLPFQALCRNVLGASSACLFPRGAVGNLTGGPFVYPADLTVQDEWRRWASGATAHSGDCHPLPGESVMKWLVPLRSQAKSPGVLLLGNKADGGMYSQEEMEVARAACENFLDTRAGMRLASQVMDLQRHRLAEIQMLDRRARRILHDEILPQVHSALLGLPPHQSDGPTAQALIATHQGISNLLREMPNGASPLARRTWVEALKHEAEQEMPAAFDEVAWQVAPPAAAVLDSLPPLVAETLFYACREILRNAARHGRGSNAESVLRVAIEIRISPALEVKITDDGVGLTPPFGLIPASARPSGARSGPASPAAGGPGADQGGSGQGLSMHATLVAVAGGQMTVENLPGRGTRALISLPLTTTNLHGTTGSGG